jgi:hypothetical protein
MGYPIFTTKLPTKTNIKAHVPSQPAEQRTDARASQRSSDSLDPLSISFDPRDIIKAPKPYDVIKALDPST